MCMLHTETENQDLAESKNDPDQLWSCGNVLASERGRMYLAPVCRKLDQLHPQLFPAAGRCLSTRNVAMEHPV